MVCYGVLQRLLHAAFPAADQQALHNTLLKGLPDLVSSGPALKLWGLSSAQFAELRKRGTAEPRVTIRSPAGTS